MKSYLWLKFYPKDWNGDHNLRSCTLAARGLLAAFLEPMHTATPYGHLLIRNEKPSYDDLAIVASCKAREVKYGIEELVKSGVLSQTEDGILYSRRMVRDAIRAEKRSKDGKKGGHPSLTPPEALQLAQQVTGSEVNHGLTSARTVVKPIEARSQKPEARSVAKEQQRATTEPSPVRGFLKWFEGAFQKHRGGARYFVNWEKDSSLVKRLFTLHSEARLKDHAVILLTATDDEFINGSDRGIGILSAKINWLEDRLTAWEAKHGKRASGHAS